MTDNDVTDLLERVATILLEYGRTREVDAMGPAEAYIAATKDAASAILQALLERREKNRRPALEAIANELRAQAEAKAAARRPATPAGPDA